MHEGIIDNYNMTDPRFKESYNEITSTYCIRTFKTMMPMVLEVVDRMKTDQYIEEKTGQLLSNGPVDLFKFMNIICEGYIIAPSEIVIRSILGLCFKLISNFQNE